MIAIAIDGPSGAGKSTLSRKIAARLGYLYVDTGALYRTIGLAAQRAGVDAADSRAVEAILPETQVQLRYVDGEQRVFLQEEDVSQQIRQEAVGMAASAVSAHVPVRQFLLETQQRLARENNVVMDGRDIGTVVLPQAQVKIFLTASPEQRAQRRFAELQQKGQPADYETVLQDVLTRDYNDSHRAAAPLKQAQDAQLVDTSDLDFDQSLERLLQVIQTRLADKGDNL